MYHENNFVVKTVQDLKTQWPATYLSFSKVYYCHTKQNFIQMKCTLPTGYTICHGIFFVILMSHFSSNFQFSPTIDHRKLTKIDSSRIDEIIKNKETILLSILLQIIHHNLFCKVFIVSNFMFIYFEIIKFWNILCQGQ